MPDDDSASAAETVFEMDPERTMRTLARSLVDGQRSLAGLRRQTHAAGDVGVDLEAARQIAATFEQLEQQWYRETLPSVVASFQLALEVFDAFGSGRTRIEDPMEAAIWNNMFFVWFTELTGRPAE
jgi:hypothetical protein